MNERKKKNRKKKKVVIVSALNDCPETGQWPLVSLLVAKIRPLAGLITRYLLLWSAELEQLAGGIFN